MKAEVAQQRSLLELSKLDAELSRIAHRATHLPQQEACERVRAEHNAASDRLAAVRIALEDLDAQVSRFESEIDAVRQREDRDRSLLKSGATDAKQLSDLQHELETLQRRQTSLEDSLLEVMERREELQAQLDAEQGTMEALQAELASAQQALDAAVAEIDEAREEHSSRRDTLSAALDPALSALYERQRAGGGPGAGQLLGRRCGACRIEIGRGELSRISAAAEDEVVRCPECGAILLRVKGFRAVKVVIEADGGSRGNPGPAGYGAVVWTEDRSTVLAETKQAIGRATNNVAEYRGLIAGLDDALKLGATEAAVYLDSKLLVEQMSGRWKVKHPDLVELHAQARRLASRFDADQLRVDSAGAQHARRPVGQRGDGRRGRGRWCDGNVRAGDTTRTGGKAESPSPGPQRRRRRPRPAGPARAARRPGCCCCGTGRPSCRCSAAIRAAATRRSPKWGGSRPRPRRVIWRSAAGSRRCYSSPLQRAYDTAAAAAKALGLDVTVDDDLIETDFGAWEGLTFAEAAERDPELHVAGCATPAPRRRAVRASTQVLDGCRGYVTGSSRRTRARRCWWCHT